jgi:hypothetical protein
MIQLYLCISERTMYFSRQSQKREIMCTTKQKLFHSVLKTSLNGRNQHIGSGTCLEDISSKKEAQAFTKPTLDDMWWLCTT